MSEFVLSTLIIYITLSFILALIIFLESSMKNTIKKLYYNKNTFGNIMSTLVVILMIPMIIFYVLFMILSVIMYLLTRVWKLGDKKEKKSYE